MHVALVALPRKIKEKKKKKNWKILRKSTKTDQGTTKTEKIKVCTSNIWKVAVLIY